MSESGSPPSTNRRSVVIAALTFRRPGDLAAALPQLAEQAASIVGGSYSARVLIVDNDPAGGARPQVESFADSELALGVPIQYEHEPVPGITAGRNRALDSATEDDVLVFIDDDERPSAEWLRLLLAAYDRYPCESVVGPVISEYETELSPWMVAGRFFDRRRLPTGTPVTLAATNNLLLDLATVRSAGLRFDPEFGISGGGDSLFTLQFVKSGGRMVWCDEAVVVDMVPANRSTPKWVLTRAFRSGNHRVRTQLRVTDSVSARAALRARYVAVGAVRCAAGAARALWGIASRNLAHQARGVRTAARGAGMIMGVTGYTHQEYRHK